MASGIANADEPEIEVTPEMLMAGTEALGAWTLEESHTDWVLEAVYRAMQAAAPEKPGITHRLYLRWCEGWKQQDKEIRNAERG